MRDGEFDAAPLRLGPLHLLKMAVGVGDIDELRRFRAARLKERGASWVYTRNHPRRTAEVLASGSIYWVIRGQIRVRQLVTGFRRQKSSTPLCASHIRTVWSADPLTIYRLSAEILTLFTRSV